MAFRSEQLVLRQHEIYLAHSIMSRLVNGDADLEISTVEGAAVDRSAWSSSSIQLDSDIAIAGHSFGGCTIVRNYLESYLFLFSPFTVHHHVYTTALYVVPNVERI